MDGFLGFPIREVCFVEAFELEKSFLAMLWTLLTDKAL